jgi:hypothetical protein
MLFIRRKADMDVSTERGGRQSLTACGAEGGPGHTGAQRMERASPDSGYWPLLRPVGVSW